MIEIKDRGFKWTALHLLEYKLDKFNSAIQEGVLDFPHLPALCRACLWVMHLNQLVYFFWRMAPLFSEFKHFNHVVLVVLWMALSGENLVAPSHALELAALTRSVVGEVSGHAYDFIAMNFL